MKNKSAGYFLADSELFDPVRTGQERREVNFIHAAEARDRD